MIGELLELRRQRSRLRWRADTLAAWTDARLRAVVRAAQRVPYYRDLFRAAGFDPARFGGVADLEHLPITEKADLREAGPARFLCDGADPATLERSATSGSSGEPFRVYFSRAEVRARRAAQVRALLAAGLGPLDRLAVLGPVRWYRPGGLQRLGLYRRVNVSPMPGYADQIARLRAFRPTLLWAYPGALHALLDHLDYRLDAVCRPRAVITSAENPDRLYRAAGDRLPAARFNFYGCIEVGRIAWECAAHRGLHVNTDQVWLEVVPNEQTPETGYGDAVVTSLINETMPLVRYRLGDLVRWADRACPCGSALPLIDAPGGRLYRPIRLPSGATRPALGVMFLLRELEWLIRFRAVQRAPDRIEVQLVTRDAVGADAIEALRGRFAEYLAEPVDVELRRVETIEGAPHKFETFVSEV